MTRKAYARRIAKDTPIPKRCQEYPNPRQEIERLAKMQDLIVDMQTTFEGPPPKAKFMCTTGLPRLETIDKVRSEFERNTS